MKKILSATLIIALFASTAMAAKIDNITGTSIGTASPTPYKASAKVTLYVVSTSTAYTLVSQHDSAMGNSTKGGKQYGSTEGNPAVSESAAGAGKADPSLVAGTQSWFQ